MITPCWELLPCSTCLIRLCNRCRLSCGGSGSAGSAGFNCLKCEAAKEANKPPVVVEHHDMAIDDKSMSDDIAEMPTSPMQLEISWTNAGAPISHAPPGAKVKTSGEAHWEGDLCASCHCPSLQGGPCAGCFKDRRFSPGRHVELIKEKGRVVISLCGRSQGYAPDTLTFITCINVRVGPCCLGDGCFKDLRFSCSRFVEGIKDRVGSSCPRAECFNNRSFSL